VPDATTKKAAIYTLGCRLNQAETAILTDRLVAAGYTLVPFGQPADLGIVHTCTVTGEADAKSRKTIRAFIRKNPDAFVAVIGCYAELAQDAIAQIDGVDLIVGSQGKLDLLDHVTAIKNAVPVIVRGPLDTENFTIPVCGDSALSRRANLKIQDGCDAMCSYCVVPFARGRPRSRALDNLIEDAKLLVARGAKEIVLSGIHVGRYRFQGQTIVDVIDRLAALDGLARVRLSSIEVTRVPEALFERMNDPGHVLVPFLHVPLQSGSDRVLERMNRPYAAAAFRAFLDRAQHAVADLCIGTDVLVGFPGETGDDFDATCRLVEETCIAYAHVFKYSPRPGTPAATFPDHLDPAVLNRRSARARRLGARKQAQFHQQYLGRTLEVLFEHAEDGRWSGYTENYIRVAVQADEDLTNDLRPATLDRPEGNLVLGRLRNG